MTLKSYCSSCCFINTKSQDFIGYFNLNSSSCYFLNTNAQDLIGYFKSNYCWCYSLNTNLQDVFGTSNSNYRSCYFLNTNAQDSLCFFWTPQLACHFSSPINANALRTNVVLFNLIQTRTILYYDCITRHWGSASKRTTLYLTWIRSLF